MNDRISRNLFAFLLTTLAMPAFRTSAGHIEGGPGPAQVCGEPHPVWPDD